MPLDSAAAFFIKIKKRDFNITRTVQNNFLQVLRQLFPSDLNIKFVMRRQARQHREGKCIALIPTANGARAKTELWEGNDAFRIKKANMPQTIAARTCAHRVVKAK